MIKCRGLSESRNSGNILPWLAHEARADAHGCFVALDDGMDTELGPGGQRTLLSGAHPVLRGFTER